MRLIKSNLIYLAFLSALLSSCDDRSPEEKFEYERILTLEKELEKEYTREFELVQRQQKKYKKIKNGSQEEFDRIRAQGGDREKARELLGNITKRSPFSYHRKEFCNKYPRTGMELSKSLNDNNRYEKWRSRKSIEECTTGDFRE